MGAVSRRDLIRGGLACKPPPVSRTEPLDDSAWRKISAIEAPCPAPEWGGLSSDDVFQETSTRYRAVEPNSGSNVILRRARPGLAGLRPHGGCGQQKGLNPRRARIQGAKTFAPFSSIPPDSAWRKISAIEAPCPAPEFLFHPKTSK